ncbi:MAG: (2Fe-2S)-binding protein [Azospirillaceae bacterium]
MTGTVAVTATINGRSVRAEVPARLTLADFLRERLALTGTHLGCEHGVCGACTVVVDGRAVRACLMLAARIDGAVVETIEGASDSGRLAALQDAFRTRGALQCGFCTAGLLLTAAELLAEDPAPTREAVRAGLSGNYCRCTGYEAIVDAVLAAAGTGDG